MAKFSLKTEFKPQGDQPQAIAELIAGIRRGDLHQVLLGVTGSGKTEIYLRATEEVIRRGKQAIILVPEIALTPQTVRRFINRFPGQVGLVHSKLSEGERYDTWRRARASEARDRIPCPRPLRGGGAVSRGTRQARRGTEDPGCRTVEEQFRAGLANRFHAFGTAGISRGTPSAGKGIPTGNSPGTAPIRPATFRDGRLRASRDGAASNHAPFTCETSGSPAKCAARFSATSMAIAARVSTVPDAWCG